ncbi:MAG: serine protein kinase PrkA [Myxococcales bacterium]|nr:serine protein kinase PrkA [Myxococcales bacterium]MCB9546105.1 serine protein kinase PrkA [Myxococcales bacterium]
MTEPTPDPRALLGDVVERTRERFVAHKSLLSFAEYLAVVAADPAAQARDAARYIRDAFDYYGTSVVKRPYGTFTRYHLFDAPFDGGRDRLVGHEPVQAAIYGLLTDFVRAGRVNKLILLHGPNGSAKSSMIACIMRGLEDYSLQPEGALYTFNWVFPSARMERGNIGFGGRRALDALDSFAHLAEGEVDARLRTETRDHPLLLLPRAARIDLLRSLLGPGAALPKSLTEGELSPKARQIHDALLRAYRGDLAEVLKHVQVERFTISRRYRQAAVTIDPQLRADATVRQVTADRSLASLPPSLHNVTLFEPMGDLVDGNRGVVEFNDLLKRPIEAFKYLLSTCENGTVRLDTMTLYMDAILIGSCNAGHLQAFQEIPDFASFKGRIELVQVPYQTDYRVEQALYAEQLRESRLLTTVAPHTEAVAALWAVLTRLARPATEGMDTDLRKAYGKLSPIEKAELYARGVAPKGLPRDTANALVANLPDLFREHRAAEEYEGRYGASAREIQAVLLGAARRTGHACLSPVSLFDELRDLCRQKSVYEFLRLKPDGPYYQPEKFIAAVKDWYLDRLEEELFRAMGLVDDVATGELFTRYIDHVTHAVRREKRLNPMTGQYEEADTRFMADLEARLGAEGKDAEDFRTGIMHRIAAWRMENPDAALDFGEIFADRITRLNDSFYEEKRRQADLVKRDILVVLLDGGERLEPEARQRAVDTLRRLETEHGHDRASITEAISFLLKERPTEA